MTKEALIHAIKTYLATGDGDAVARRLFIEALVALDKASVTTEHSI